jgi:hypothetical protein
MSFLFRNDTAFNTIELLDLVFGFVLDTWMCLKHGEGEKEIENHGRSRVKSFSQGTEDKGQQSPRIGAYRPSKESSAGCTRFSDSTPHFFFSKHVEIAVLHG